MSVVSARAALLVVTLAACYSPKFREGLPCSDAGKCPQDQECASDGKCYQRGTVVGPDAPCAPSSRVPELRQRIEAAEQATGDNLGIAIARSGSWLALGSPSNSGAASRAGVVRMFEHDGSEWVERMTLNASDAAADHLFGTAIDMDDTFMVVGAPGAGGNGEGSAYVFELSGGTWTERAILAPSGGLAGDSFGAAVTIDDEFIAVGAPDESSGTGALYLFRRMDPATWPPDGAFVPGDETTEFGEAVAIDGPAVAIGSPGDDDDGESAGSVFRLARAGEDWMSQGKLTASDGDAFDDFGFSIALDGDTLVVGAVGRQDRGALYVYSGGNFSDELVLVGNDTEAADGLGQSVAISGDFIAGGAPQDDDIANSAGSVVLFGRDGEGWAQAAKLTDPDGAEFDLFGHQVSLEGTELLVGAPLANGTAENAGSVLSYQLLCP